LRASARSTFAPWLKVADETAAVREAIATLLDTRAPIYA
jgi:hypothetical protein